MNQKATRKITPAAVRLLALDAVRGAVIGMLIGTGGSKVLLAAALPGKNVLFAFALSAGHREVDRVVSIDLKKITIGQLPGAISNKQLIGRIFHGTKYKVVYEPNMEDYLLCHAAFVMPAAFACYKTDGDLKKLRGDTAYLNRVLDVNIEGYRAIRNAGHAILPKGDADFEGEKYRKTCLRFFKLMCATSLGKLCASDHAMNAIDEMSALNRDLKKFFDEHGAAYPVWQALEAEALRLVEEDKQLCDRIAEAGSALVKPGSRLLTHCNTGGLATAGVGTALGVIALAHRQGKVTNVWVDETRPLLQGGRLTAWELGELGVPYQLIADSMAASLMAQGQVDAVWVGADRIAANGDVANKIGTYSLAVLAHYHQIPFYVAAPQTTLDRYCPNGAAIPIEQRAAAEVTGVAGSFGAVQWAPTGAAVYNPAFDVTPAGLISGWVLDSGVVTPAQVAAGAFAPDNG